MRDIINLAICLFILISPFFTGLYFEKHFFGATFFLALLLVFQIVNCILKKEKFNLGDKKIFTFIILFLILNLFTYFLNIVFQNEYYDYMIIVNGFVQMLEMVLFYFVVTNVEKSKIKYLNYAFIISGIVLTLLCTLPEFYRNDRFEGTFGYANSFAIYLFICMAMLISENIKKKYKVIFVPILILGIILTNSRFTYLITLLFLLIKVVRDLIYKCKNKNINNSKNKSTNIITSANKNSLKKDMSENKKNNDSVKMKKVFYLIILICAGLLITIVGLFILKNESISSRFDTDIILRDVKLKLSYYEEAVNIIKENPFGLGYEGYLTSQSVKENKYKLRLVHNFLLQWALNYGVITLFLGFAFIIYYIMKCKKQRKLLSIENIIIFLVLFHSMQDVSLSFLSVDNLLIFLAMKNFYMQENN